MWKPTPMQRNILLMVGFGLVVRYILGILLTYPRDISSWIVNSENFLSGGGLYGLPGHYYTPVWGYVMAVLTAIAAFTGMPISQYVPDFAGDVNALPWYTTLPSMEYALLIKTFLFIVDLLVTFVIYRIAMHITSNEKLSAIAAAIWFLCPLTIVISSIRVMFENLEILFLLLSVLMMLERRPGLAGFMLGISLLVKPYGMFLGVMMIGYAYARSGSARDPVVYVLSILAAGLVLMAPVILAGDLGEAMYWLSVRAENIGSGYNNSLLVMPLLLVASSAISLIIAIFRVTDMRFVMAAGMVVMGAMLVIPGNVQYYLLILPFAILMLSRWSIPVFLMLLLISFYAGVSFTSWSATLYVSEQLWAWETLQAIGDYLYPYEHYLNYNMTKALTGFVAVASPFVGLFFKQQRGVRADALEP